MCIKLFLLLSVLLLQEVSAADTYVAEMVVESKPPLEASAILFVMNQEDLKIHSQSGELLVSVLQAELVAECLLVQDETTCNCAAGFIWSNKVCYHTSTCCNDSACYANVSYFTPLCVAKVQVHINGSVQLTSGTWSDSNRISLINSFAMLNGFQSLNVTNLRDSNVIADFEVDLSVKFKTVRLQNILDALEASLDASIKVDTLGLVYMQVPGSTVCYLSAPRLHCLMGERSGSAGWNMSRGGQRFQLNNGSVVALDHHCATEEHSSCVAVTLHNVTGNWAGVFECGFTQGSVRHTARATLSVALLPDVVWMQVEPLTLDCSTIRTADQLRVKVTAIIRKVNEMFNVFWSYQEEQRGLLQPKAEGDFLLYSVEAPISCRFTEHAHYVQITFRNQKNQEKSGRVDIPVIYAGAKFCDEEVVEDAVWPKAPDGDTVFNSTCEYGRVGFRARTCSRGWREVFSYCVSGELIKVLEAANNFNQGLGASQKVAEEIFRNFKNVSKPTGVESNDMADLMASICLLETMAGASGNVPLQDQVFPDLIDAASNMLNQSWNRVNNSIKYTMSSRYLKSVEGLVRNIRVNNSTGVSSENVGLHICRAQYRSNCNNTVFSVVVNLNSSSEIIKTMGVRNIVEKLRNNYVNTETTSVLISTTVEEDSESSMDITLIFPNEFPTSYKTALCVFWDITLDDWSSVGCHSKTSERNLTVCHCNHLTSFSVLMSQSDITFPFLDEITYMGLGVSICSLLVFLLIEALVWSTVAKSNLSHFRHTALVNISVCLLLADCSLLASSFPKVTNETWCFVVSFTKHFFFLAMFCWMLCLSVMLVHQLIFVFNPLRKRVFMFFSSIIGYVVPTLIVGSTYLYYKYMELPYFNEEECWLTYDGLLRGSMHAFLLPVGMVVLINLFTMFVVIIMLMKSSIPESCQSEKNTAKSILKVVVILTPVFGVTWILGFFQLMLDEKEPITAVVYYAFTTLNSFQGFFILVAGVFAEQKVREEVLRIITPKAPSNGLRESANNLTTASYTKSQ